MFPCSLKLHPDFPGKAVNRVRLAKHTLLEREPDVGLFNQWDKNQKNPWYPGIICVIHLVLETRADPEARKGHPRAFNSVSRNSWL